MTAIAFKLVGYLGWLATLFLGIAGSWFWNFTQLDPDNPQRKRLTVAGRRGVYVMVVSALWAVLATTYGEIKSYYSTLAAIKENERLQVFTHSGLEYIDEASGATFDPRTNVAYVVDDDKPSLFRFEFNSHETKYDLVAELSLTDKSGTEIDGSNLEDLEAIAFYQGKLYAMTSHSNKITGVEQGKRQRLLEILVHEGKSGQIIQSVNLRKPILERLRRGVSGRERPLRNMPLDDEDRLEVMNIEGFAISPAGRAYIGFRSPLVDDRYALVLTAELAALFKGEPKLDAVLLELLFEGNHYAITDMAFDVNGKDVLIIGNSRKRLEFLSPVLWRWQPRPNPGFQQVERLQHGIMQPPELFHGKTEAIVVPKADYIGFFADAEGYGGQRVYKRSELGLQ